MKALVTGGAGFIGSHLTDRLLSIGYEVVVLDDLSTGRISNVEAAGKNPAFTFRQNTIMDRKIVNELVSECDVIFHLAAIVGVKRVLNNLIRTIESNVYGTEIVLKAATRHNKKVIITSSSEVYGKGNSLPFKEDDDVLYGPVTRSRWAYACSKSINEFYALACWKEKQLQVVIIRLFNTIGPRQSDKYGMVIPTLIRQALKNQTITIYGDGQQTRTFSYVGDVVRALIGISEDQRALGEVFNVGSKEEISINELASLIKRVTGSKSEIHHIPYERAYNQDFEDMRRRVPDISKIRDAIGYQPEIGLVESLEEIIRYYREQYYLFYPNGIED